MIKCFYKITLILSIVLFNHISTEKTDWLYDDAPGIAIEYKIHIDAGKEDCYWQYVHPGATLYVNMQVLKGGDGMAGMAVKNPRNEIVHTYQWQQNSEYEETVTEGGYYSVCIDNQFSRFSAKLINIYLTTFRYDAWENYTKELEELDVSVNKFVEAISKVDQKVHEMLQHQSISRAREGRDYQLLLENNSYIQYWSIAQCVAIVTVCSLQLFSVKRLFEDTAIKKTKSGARA